MTSKQHRHWILLHILSLDDSFHPLNDLFPSSSAFTIPSHLDHDLRVVLETTLVYEILSIFLL